MTGAAADSIGTLDVLASTAAVVVRVLRPGSRLLSQYDRDLK